MEPLVFETAVDLATETPTQTFNGHELTSIQPVAEMKTEWLMDS